MDDETGIRTLLSVVFESAGYEVRLAADATAAQRHVEAESFHVMLSDVRMPGMNGHELVRWVVTRRPETRTILMSGYDDIHCQGCGFAKQPCSLLSKPFVPKQAVALVNEMLRRTSVS